MDTIIQAIESAKAKHEIPSTPKTISNSLSASTHTTHQCDACGDTGWRPARTGEIIQTTGGTVFAVREWDAGQYRVPCEKCVQLRIDRQRAELQSISMLTEEEQQYRLCSIQVSGKRQDTRVMVDACGEMVDGRAFMLTIWGSNGNAKSAALIATVNEFLDRGIPAIYLPSYDLLNWLQDAFNRDGEIKSESMYARLERIKSIRMLAIDEFQAIKNTDWRLEQLRNLVDRRWRDGLDGRSYTLFAMNENPATLEPRIWSRLRDGRNRMSGNPVILNNDADMRPLLRRKS